MYMDANGVKMAMVISLDVGIKPLTQAFHRKDIAITIVIGIRIA